MRKFAKVLVTSCFFVSCMGIIPAQASMNLETESSLAGITVALNNFYASSVNPEKDLAERISSDTALAQAQAGKSEAKDVPTVTASRSAYENVAISRVTDYVNVRTEANTTSEVVGKIYNNCAATILATVEGEGGEWYQIQSGSVKGYIKAEYFITGSEAEAIAKQAGKVFATVVNTQSLRLREKPDPNSKTLTLLAEGARYVVLEEKDNYAKLQVDEDLEGYVSEDYVKITVEFEKAVSVEEEKAKAAEDAKIKKEAEDALRQLEEAKKAAAKKQQESKAAETKPAETKPAETKPAETAPQSTESATIAPKPGEETAATTAAPKPTEAPATEAPTTKANSDGPGGGSSGPSGDGPGSGAVTSATRTALVAYSKQFLGNPYVYGGTSLTNGADCSGFTQAIYAHFGLSIPRNSRDQAAGGTPISWENAQPGDLLFYGSGSYINHVAMYIGGGQVIHASSSTTGIILSPANYRTPLKAVTYLK